MSKEERELTDVINVRANGAAGDGQTDDYEAIQRCITLAEQAGGGTVYFPPGKYVVNGTLSLKQGAVGLAGSNAAATVIVEANTSVSLLEVGNNGKVVNHTTIRDLSVEYAEPGATGALMTFHNVWRTYLMNVHFGNSGCYYKMGSGVSVVGGGQFHILQCIFSYPLQYGIYTALIGDVHMDNLEINLAEDEQSVGAIFDSNTGGIYATNVNVNSGGTGFRFVHSFTDTQPPNYGFFTNCLADTQFGGNGWDFQCALSMVLTNSWAATAKGIGIYADRVTGLGIHDSRIYWNGEEGIAVTGHARDVTVSGSRIHGNSKREPGERSGIRIDPAARNVMVTNNRIGEGDGFPDNHAYAIDIGAGEARGLMVQGNMLLTNRSGGIRDSSAGGNKHIAGNWQAEG
ncbi:hypothetical protein PA598K_00015 [Paenibacillus sp. 598K]|uniref:right-handed parallel beta-helix repeat-containing protein n=1 Tax=Paenibacillus sp. 598K TaxID=1117987 RepID=UPI000FFAB205|nr:right-handed parallel beta-helix repeat-containing protein [Paenibacillus sp. 598K]GBF71803.1 hypothetical protein PA598K_00015 [Paenibacillus sp. 598K]